MVGHACGIDSMRLTCGEFFIANPGFLDELYSGGRAPEHTRIGGTFPPTTHEKAPWYVLRCNRHPPGEVTSISGLLLQETQDRCSPVPGFPGFALRVPGKH